MIDITEKLALESQVRQSQKMDSIGRLAGGGGVAHDFNNMLSVIMGRTELAMGQMEPFHPLFDHLQEINKASKRSAALVRQLLAFARKQTVIPKVLDLNKTVGGMLNMLRPLIGENIDLDWVPTKATCLVKIDPSQIDQILANLCVNARDAISDVGKISIETEVRTFKKADYALHPESLPGEYVMLKVIDTGGGMDQHTLDNLFEPFYTTKDMGKGTGLGLATVYGIVKQNKGFVEVQSEVGHGTSFKVYLPKCRAEIEEIGKKTEVSTPSTGHETILLVEDEPAILDIGRLMLTELGYKVLTASNPRDALRIAKDCASEIDLLITDVIMPEQNGWDLAQDLTAIIPRLKCLFVSGYSEDVIDSRRILAEDCHFIYKPFLLKELSAKVREVMDI